MVNNPRRVPPTLEQIDPHQEGAPRVIHPIGSDPIRVGRPVPPEEITIMDRPEQFFEVKESKVVTSRNGKSQIQVAAGTRIPKYQAYEYGLLDEPVSTMARPEGEQAAVAHDTPVTFTSEAQPAEKSGKRKKGAAPETPEGEATEAPENRAEANPAPENRSAE